MRIVLLSLLIAVHLAAADVSIPDAPVSATIPAPAGVATPPLAVGRYILPVTGTWFVLQGGDTPNVNQHEEFPVRAQWYALDLVGAGGPGKRALTDGDASVASHWYGFGRPVVCPAAGEVIEAENEMPDNPIGTMDAENPYGNYAAIRVCADEIVVIAHMQQHSVKVKRGDHVVAGQPLGVCGNSGNSSAPHVHIHVQDTGVEHANGKAIVFHDIQVGVDGVWMQDPPFPLLRGMFIQGDPPHR